MIKNLTPRLYLLLLCCIGILLAEDCQKQDVGNYRLYYCVAGKSDITVVLDADIKDFSKSWSTIFPKIARYSRVFKYDRPGLGKSDSPGSTPLTSRQAARDLYQLLQEARVPGPYLLVGHGLGGWNMRMFARLYPGDTAGLLLIDSPHENFDDERDQLLQSSQKSTIKRIPDSFSYQPYQSGKVLDLPPKIKNEYRNADQTRKSLRVQNILGNKPLIILSAEKHRFTPKKHAHKLEKVWKQQQRYLTNLSTDSRIIIARKSGHYIQFDQPDLVVKSIKALLKSIRTNRPISKISL